MSALVNFQDGNPYPYSPSGHEVFVGGLSIKTVESTLGAYLNRFGNVLSLRIKRFNGKSRGFAYVVFEHPESAKNVIAQDHFLDGKKFSCTEYVPNALAQVKVKDEKTRKIFVNCLPPEATEAHISNYFLQFGPVERVSLNRFIDGRSKKSAFVLFEDETTTKKLLRRRHTTEHRILNRKIFFYQSLTKKEIYEFTFKKDCNDEPQELISFENKDQCKVMNSSTTSEDPNKKKSAIGQDKYLQVQMIEQSKPLPSSRNQAKDQRPPRETDFNGNQISKGKIQPNKANEFQDSKKFIVNKKKDQPSRFVLLQDVFGHDCLANFLKINIETEKYASQNTGIRFNLGSKSPYCKRVIRQIFDLPKILLQS